VNVIVIKLMVNVEKMAAVIAILVGVEISVAKVRLSYEECLIILTLFLFMTFEQELILL